MKFFFGFLMNVAFASAMAHADPLAHVDGTVSLSGSGCPRGTYNVTLSPDKTDVSILFDKYSIRNNRGANLKHCWVKIPIIVSQGYRMVIHSSAYRGFYSLPDDARASVESFAVLKGKRQARSSRYVKRKFTQETEDDFRWDAGYEFGLRQCGGRHELHLFSLLVLKNHSSDRTLAEVTLDSMDFSLSSLTEEAQVSFVPCQ